MVDANLSADGLDDFAEVVTAQLGIRMPPGKRGMLRGRLERRARELDLDLREYHRRFFEDPAAQAAEFQHLLDLATTNKTDFFREPTHFTHLTDQVVPAWRAAPPGGVFRVWCAGCATGEEAYTLAIVLLEARARHDFAFSILATDVSTRALQVALRAIYPEEQARPVPPTLRSKYLLRGRDSAARLVRIAPEVRALVRFGHLNFLAPRYGIPQPVDVVFFRNVMIYFDRETQRAVVARMCRHLRAGGFLFIAHAETLEGLGLPLRLVGPGVFQRQKDTP